MNNIDRKEMFSAFADAEAVNNKDAELVDLICHDQQLRSAWMSTHLTRDVLQGDYHTALSPDFAAKVSASIAREESFGEESFAGDDNMAPVVSMSMARDRVAKSKVRRSESAGPSRSALFWRPVAGLGLAASLAGAVFLAPQLWQSEQTEGTQLADSNLTNQQVVDTEQADFIALQDQIPAPADAAISVADSATDPTDIESVTLQAAVRIGNGGTRWRMDQETSRNDAIEQRLNMLLTNHLESASMGSVNGLISHSKVVGYDSMPQEPSE